MKILADNRCINGWITCVIENHWVQAKVYNLPSEFGVKDGRVSKLAIGKTNQVLEGQNFFNQICYNYDRGLDFDNAPAGLVDKVVEELEKLPTV